MAAPTLFLFDRWDERLGTLPVLGALTHSEEIGGEDTLEFDCERAPEKGDRLLWRDPEGGAWREHVVVRTDERSGGACHVYAEWALGELLRDYVEELQLVQRTATQAMAMALSAGGCRWELGGVGVGDARRSTLVYHTNALAALRRIESVWGGELECEVEVSGGRVAARRVSLPERIGGRRGARFSYGRNLLSCRRTVLEDEVVTALYGWGKGLPIEGEDGTPTGGYTRRLSFADANGGVKWVCDEAARERWGRWDATRTKRVHAFGHVVFPECEDAAELLALTRAELERASRPRVSYECDVAQVAGGVPVGLGDDVAVVDASREPAWRLTARCVRRVRSMGDGEPRCRVTLGSVERATWAVAAETAYRVATVEDVAGVAADKVATLEDLNGREF